MPKMKDCPKNEQLANKRSFEGKCDILRTSFQPRALSSDRARKLSSKKKQGTARSQERGVFKLNPPINFCNARVV